MIDLRLAYLRSFVAVADASHFGRAAEALGLGQSAVSQHVRRLEDELGAELLTRTSRSVALTPAGGRLLDVARSLLSDVDRSVAEVRAVAAGELGTLRVAAQQAARAFIVPGTLARLAAEVPGLTLDVVSATTAEALAAVRDGTADVALCRDPTPRDGLVLESLADDPVMVALPAAHPLAARETLALPELRGEPRIGWQRRGAPDYHDRIAEVLRAAGLDPEPRFELRGVDTRLGAVGAGLGYALESAAYRGLLSGRVSFVAIAGEPISGTVVAAWPAVRPAPGVPAFLRAAREAAAVGAAV